MADGQTILAFRRACAAQPGHDEVVQLNATARIGISCEPAEGDVANPSPPCLHEPFFHFARGFEGMSAEIMARHSDKRRNGIDPYVQCRIRRVGHDEDWPTVDAYHQRRKHTKTIVDIMEILGSRHVTMVGASLVRQALGAMQCQLEAAGLRRRHELQWRHWGWSTFASDNRGCTDVWHAVADSGERRFERLKASGCIARGSAFASMLNASDVVIVGYNPQHYESSLAWWRHDLSVLIPMLAEFARQPGKLAIVREPPAQHFAGGVYELASARFVSATRGCCQRLNAADAYRNFNYDAVAIVHELVAQYGAGRVRILPWYNATLQRWNAHVASRAACFEQRGDAAWARRRECVCDCTHFCYTPLFWDATILTPVHKMLRHAMAASETSAKSRWRLRHARRLRFEHGRLI